MSVCRAFFVFRVTVGLPEITTDSKEFQISGIVTEITQWVIPITSLLTRITHWVISVTRLLVKNQWSKVNSQWSKANGQKSKVNIQLSIVNCQLSITYPPPKCAFCQLFLPMLQQFSPISSKSVLFSPYSRVMPFLCAPSDPSAQYLGVRRVRRVTSFWVKPLYTRAYIVALPCFYPTLATLPTPTTPKSMVANWVIGVVGVGSGG